MTNEISRIVKIFRYTLEEEERGIKEPWKEKHKLGYYGKEVIQKV